MIPSGFPWRTLLFASLALNILTIGAALGAWFAGVRVERAAPGAVVERMPGPRAFLGALPPETRTVLRRELAASWADSRAMRRAALEARRDAFAAASAEPYDAARVRAAFARLREADQAAIGIFHDNIIEAFGRLTPEQRRQALEALRSAAPATRAGANSAVEESEGASSAAPAGPQHLDRGAMQERREERRERIRERLRQRREGQR
ncbi:MAG: periplasmic heavy metal sensor [Hyphomonadaceae bacterium]